MKGYKNNKSEMFAGEEELYGSMTEQPQQGRERPAKKPLKPVWSYPLVKPLFWAELLVLKGLTGYAQIYLLQKILYRLPLYHRLQGGLFILAGAVLYAVWAFLGGISKNKPSEEENRAERKRFDFEKPLTQISFWLTASLGMAATHFLTARLTSPLEMSFWQLWLTDMLPFAVLAAVYAAWSAAAARKKVGKKQQAVSVSEAWASTLTDKGFWLSWALSAAAFGVCFDMGIIGELLWLVAVFMIFVDGKTGRK